MQLKKIVPNMDPCLQLNRFVFWNAPFIEKCTETDAGGGGVFLNLVSKPICYATDIQTHRGSYIWRWLHLLKSDEKQSRILEADFDFLFGCECGKPL